MARISDITVMEQPEYYSLTIRKIINFMDEFSEFTSDSFKKIMDYLAGLGILVAGEPMVCFHNMDLEQLDVEVGFPLAKQIYGNSVILSGIVPAQKVVSAIDLGAYEQQDDTLYDMFTWIQNNGYEMKGDIYYQYLNAPNRPTNEYLTKMIIPIH